MLVDSHCHLDYLAADGDLDAVVARARESGVGVMLTISTTLGGFDTVRAIAERYDDVWCTVGVHPHEAEEAGATTADSLIALAEHPKVVGIGETGLDYHYERSPREAQQRSFRAHIAAARETGLPLVVHSRAADADTTAILAEEYGKGPFTGLIHCFSVGRHVAEKALEIGLYISLSGILTFARSEGLRAIARDLPLDRLLVETDAPYLAPVPMRGRRNEPAFVVYTAETLAELKNLDPIDLAKATTDNFFRLFTRVLPPAGSR